MKIDKICIINLKSAKKRLSSCKTQLKKEKLEGEKCVEGVDGFKFVPYGKELKTKKNPRYYGKLMRNSLTKKNLYKKTSRALRVGEIGVYMSHINTIKKAFSNKRINHLLIFEDDMKLEKNFKKNLEKILKEMPSNNDILFLGISDINYKYAKFKSYNKLFNKPLGISKIKDMKGGIYGAHAYILNRKAMKTIIENAFPMEYPYDVYLGRLITINNLLNGLTLKKDIVKTYNYGSYTMHTKTLN